MEENGYWALFWHTGLPQAWACAREREQHAQAAARESAPSGGRDDGDAVPCEAP